MWTEVLAWLNEPVPRYFEVLVLVGCLTGMWIGSR